MIGNTNWRWGRSAFWSFLAVVICALLFVPVPGFPSGIAPAAYNTIQSAGSALTQRPTLNFISGTTCVDNAGANRTDCTSAGGGTGPTGATGPGGGITAYSSLSVTLSGGTTVYVPFGGDGVGSGTETNVQMKVQPSILVQGACLTLSAAPGTGNSIVATLRDNAADTAVTMTVSNAATSACDSTHSVTTASGDLLDWSLAPSGVIALYAPNVMISTQAGYPASSGSGIVTSGTWASVGATPAANEFYSVSDSPGLFGIYNSGWNFYTDTCQVTPPITNSAITGPTFSWRNQGSATVTTVGGFVNFSDPGAGSGGTPDLAGRETTIPSSPFSITITYIPTTMPVSFTQMGLYFADGSGKIVTFGPLIGGNPGVAVGHLNSATSFSGFASDQEPNGSGGSPWYWVWGKPMTLKIGFAGGTATFSISNDCGTSFQTFFSESTTAFTGTPTVIGVFIDPQGTYTPSPNAKMYLLSWLQQ